MQILSMWHIFFPLKSHKDIFGWCWKSFNCQEEMWKKNNTEILLFLLILLKIMHVLKRAICLLLIIKQKLN